MFVLRNRYIFLTISAVLVLASIVIMAIRPFNLSIEFTGGTVLEVSYEEAPDIQVLKQQITEAGFTAEVQSFGERGVILRSQEITESDRAIVLEALTITDEEGEEILLAATEERFTAIGPSIGNELRRKAVISLLIVGLAIVLFVAYAFRKVSEPVSSWRYGLVAIIALLHDVIIPIGIFVLLGLEIDTLFVVGLLSILGLSVNDTIVVFDRIRENLALNDKNNRKESFIFTVGKSVRQTVARSINTSFTLIVVLVALWVVGPAATTDLAFVLLIGTLLGTYSSIFVASPLLVLMTPKTKQVTA